MRGRWPSSRIRCSSRWVPSEDAANTTCSAVSTRVAEARPVLALVNFTWTSYPPVGRGATRVTVVSGSTRAPFRSAR